MFLAFARVLIGERDEYLAQTIYDIARVVGNGGVASGGSGGGGRERPRIVAVVGAGHLVGIQKHLANGGDPPWSSATYIPLSCVLSCLMPSPTLLFSYPSLLMSYVFSCRVCTGISEERIIEISSSSKHVQGTWLGRGMMHVLSPQVLSFTHFFHLTFLVLSPLVWLP